MNARKHGETTAEERAATAWLHTIGRILYASLRPEGVPPELRILYAHALPDDLETDTATRWLHEHRRIRDAFRDRDDG